LAVENQEEIIEAIVFDSKSDGTKTVRNFIAKTHALCRAHISPNGQCRIRRSPTLQFFPAKDCTVIETDATHRKRIRLAAIAQPCILPQTL
jgi:hypothetical protein